MKSLNKLPILSVAVFLCVACGSSSAVQESDKAQMATEMPAGIKAPAEVQTRLGTLRTIDGFPDSATIEKVYDNLDFQRGVQAVLTAMPAASLSAMRKGLREFGPDNQTVVMFEQLMDSKSLFLTANTTTIYNFMWLNIKDGPLVVEVPPKVLGTIDDFWFHWVGDIGNTGPDKGQGGKYLLLPPGYKDSVPDGYFVLRPPTYNNWMFFRGFEVDGSTAPAVASAKKNLRIYPLSQKDNPPAMNFVNGSGKFFNTIHSLDYSVFEEVNEVVQEEPVEASDPETLGLLASIGIEKGKPFKPDARMKKILTEAAAVGNITARTLAYKSRIPEAYFYENSAWNTPFVGGSYQFLKEKGVRNLDARTFFFFYATGITPAMAEVVIGKGSAYAVAFVDAKGDPFDGSKNYKLHLPPNIPEKNFWSFTLYDMQSRSMLQTDQQFPSVSSLTKGLVVNPDKSVDIYFGPKAPAGKENNWMQTMPGKGWSTIFRLYSPLEPWFDKTWRPGEIELVE
ncbi:MAG: DUF1254 domain-containing protein [Myxococcales bacterium]|nr:DUF1254 domain-containing protein [Myxococcales bacterium]